MPHETITVKVGEQELIFETGKIARQANGAVLVRCGDTIIFNSACAATEAKAAADFFPLKVDYQELLSSAGKTSNGFIKRQGRPSEREILTSRLIDRPLRPMFPEGYFNEVQVLSYVWSYDGSIAPEPLAICGASAALLLSDIPLIKPVAAVRVAFIDNQLVLNPTIAKQRESKLDLTLAGTEDGILMIEGYCDFLTEEQVVQAIELGHSGIKTICSALDAWQKKIGKTKNLGTLKQLPEGLLEAIDASSSTHLDQALRIADKQDREQTLSEIETSVIKELLPEGELPKYSELDIQAALKLIKAKHMRKMILTEDRRSDGRNSKQIRPIFIEQHYLPRAHGSSLFTRGETQAMAVCTLGGESMAQRYEDLEGEASNRFYLHYFFPPFSVGEVGRVGAPGRREVGHGKLAERGLQAILPSKESFPYTIRIESNITESNGSSSMASVCGGCLAMMDAGVPIKRPVAGIAMGLILEGEEYAVLSDILGIEDALGDMDFKVTGDKDGITAFQMDIKIEGITPAIMKVALAQAKEGRIHILDKMLEACPQYREQMSIYAPRIVTIRIKPSMIAKVIGPGGKQIREITEQSGVKIDISDDGLISLSSSNAGDIEKAKAFIDNITAEIEIGRVYTGKATSVVPFGVFVEVLPGKEGLCHISEFDMMRIDNIADHVKQGDILTVKVLDINERGQLRLSRKATLSAPAA
ncbi:MAG: polyribonucleotide nucleotidyltransferase [Parachlamydiaceae bacterium]|nr:polyribonucleotide nucleotidyltransferase [Parachlamydiaceae bacterium]